MQPNPKRRIHVERGIYYRALPGGKRRYEITYLDSDGRRRWQTVDGGLKEARSALRKVHTRKERGERVAPSKLRFEDFARAWHDSQTHLRRTTRDTYDSHLRNHLFPRMGHLRLHDVTEDTILALLAAMRKDGKSAATQKAVLIVLGRSSRTRSGGESSPRIRCSNWRSASARPSSRRTSGS